MPVYLDHNATTPLDPRVLEAMLPHLREGYGNPSSPHAPGRAGRTAVETAREQVACLVGAHPSQVIFTSGGTEANNAALKGVASRRGSVRLAMSGIEHASLAGPAGVLERDGWQAISLPVDADGRVPLSGVAEALESGAEIVALMWANNETGVVQEVPAAAALARARGALLHTDAVQAAGKLPVDFGASGAHSMSLSAHKIGGPKGIGALVLDKSLELEPLLHGGGQEKSRRGGTENVPAIVGFGRAAEIAAGELRARHTQLQCLRDEFETALLQALPQAVVFGAAAERLPNTSFFAVPGVEGETLILGLDRRGFAVSAGSACGSSHAEPSPVLQAMGVAPDLARCAVRVSFGPENSAGDALNAVGALAAEVALLQRMASARWA